jgi:phospholipase/carboxylesterase
LKVAQALIVLLHGVGGTPAAMAPLADRIAAALPHARIAAPPAALPYDLGPEGHQWFSVDGITEQNRPARIQAALPTFIDTIRSVQRVYGAASDNTVLAGFSQGAIMALAACTDTRLARHVVAIAGRFAPLPAAWEGRTAVSLVHGSMDGTMAADHSRGAGARLAELGADVHLDLVPRAVHLLGPAIVDAAINALTRPLRLVSN